LLVVVLVWFGLVLFVCCCFVLVWFGLFVCCCFGLVCLLLFWFGLFVVVVCFGWGFFGGGLRSLNRAPRFTNGEIFAYATVN